VFEGVEEPGNLLSPRAYIEVESTEFFQVSESNHEIFLFTPMETKLRGAGEKT